MNTAVSKTLFAHPPRPADAAAVAGLRAAADERARRAELERVRVEGEQATAAARSAERRKRRRLALGAAAVVVMAAVGGLTAVLAVQRRANADLAAKNAELKTEQAKVRAERQQAVTNLYHARVEEAAALRRARAMGYRAQVFNRLQQALQLDTPDKDIDRLRQEAVACLGDFVGLEPIIWEDFPAGIQTIALTPDGEQMAIALDNGTIQLHRERRRATARIRGRSRYGSRQPVAGELQFLPDAPASASADAWRSGLRFAHHSVSGEPGTVQQSDDVTRNVRV
jgi:hypothetical protein